MPLDASSQGESALRPDAGTAGFAPIPIARGGDEARRTVLRRRRLDEALSDAEVEVIQRCFSEPLSAEQAVQRIIGEVRDGGDAALRVAAAVFLDANDSRISNHGQHPQLSNPKRRERTNRIVIFLPATPRSSS